MPYNKQLLLIDSIILKRSFSSELPWISVSPFWTVAAVQEWEWLGVQMPSVGVVTECNLTVNRVLREGQGHLMICVGRLRRSLIIKKLMSAR